MKNNENIEFERYVITIEGFEKPFERSNENIFFAIDEIKQEIGGTNKPVIISAYIIKNNDFIIDITDFLNY